MLNVSVSPAFTEMYLFYLAKCSSIVSHTKFENRQNEKEIDLMKLKRNLKDSHVHFFIWEDVHLAQPLGFESQLLRLLMKG